MTNTTEWPASIEITSGVDGGILLHILTETYNFDGEVHAGIKVQNIKMSRKQQESWTIAEK